MARISITFEDNPDGTIHINMDSDEVLHIEPGEEPKNLERFTHAQQAAVMAIDYIFTMIDGIEKIERKDLHERTETLH